MFIKVEKNKYLDHDLWRSDIVKEGNALDRQFIRFKDGKYTLEIKVNGTSINVPLRKNEAEHIIDHTAGKMLYIQTEVTSSEFV